MHVYIYFNENIIVSFDMKQEQQLPKLTNGRSINGILGFFGEISFGFIGIQLLINWKIKFTKTAEQMIF